MYLRSAAPAADPGEKKEVCAVFSHSSSWWLFHSHDTRGEIERESEIYIYIYIELNFTRARQYILDVFLMFVYVAF